MSARSDRTIAARARLYVEACRAVNEDCTSGGYLEAVNYREAAWHDLCLAVGAPCGCRRGTCPGPILELRTPPPGGQLSML